jgi:hypothetical protein
LDTTQRQQHQQQNQHPPKNSVYANNPEMNDLNCTDIYHDSANINEPKNINGNLNNRNSRPPDYENIGDV